mmetsp:Transcript_39392/g.63926  ORF Transcript_39392/g.63926 Transcript_39392/m.63926 type:complete len:354 (-) Transcript_39392:922-1983(-)
MIRRSPNEMERPSVTSISTLREIKLLREMTHDNVVKLTDVVIDSAERDVALVMDFAAWTLSKILEHHRKKKVKISDYMRKAIMYQSLLGLEYLHRNWVMHRDLKPENILIIGDGEKRGLLQLADLGLSRIFKAPVVPLGHVDKYVVTLWYRSPELLLGATHYTTAADIWSLGCIFSELFVAHNQFVPIALFSSKSSEKNLSFEKEQCFIVFSTLGIPTTKAWPEVNKLPNFQKLLDLKEERKGSFPVSSTLPQRLGNDCDKAAMDLLCKMLELNPAKRISASECLQHGYFSSFLKIPRNLRTSILDEPGNPRRKEEYSRSDIGKIPDEKKVPIAIQEQQQKVLAALKSKMNAR